MVAGPRDSLSPTRSPSSWTVTLLTSSPARTVERPRNGNTIMMSDFREAGATAKTLSPMLTDTEAAPSFPAGPARRRAAQERGRTPELVLGNSWQHLRRRVTQAEYQAADAAKWRTSRGWTRRCRRQVDRAR